MFGATIARLNAVLDNHAWARGLAGILPLSALIDFIDVPRKLHVLELTGNVPWWNWPITPSGSRILLSDEHTKRTCYLDRYGNSVALYGLDGRYGDQYIVSSPETLRMCIETEKTQDIPNDHENMDGNDLRLQNLSILKISRQNTITDRPKLPRAPLYAVVWTAGSIIWLGMVVMSSILGCWESLAFLIVILFTGVVTYLLYGNAPRRLLVENASDFNRLVLVAEHMNSMDWMVFYGESTIINSLVNRPLEPKSRLISKTDSIIRLMILRMLIFGQWCMVVAAAALGNWSAYFITFWIVFCIFSHAYLIPPLSLVSNWMKLRANLKLERYETQLSSRRALLNTILALNPDTFNWNDGSGQYEQAHFRPEGLMWIDPILARGAGRTKWEEATREAMEEASQRWTSSLASPTWRFKGRDDLPSATWNQKYPSDKHYWKPFVLEGIYMAAKIKEAAGLSGRMVSKLAPKV